MSDVSVIITTYNRCVLIPRAVESARRAGNNLEIIIVDDASQDRTQDVCEAMRDVRYIRVRRRRGVSGARNIGVIASTAPYLCFLDDDDVRLPGTIDAQVALLKANPMAAMIYGRVLFGDEECRPKGGFYPQRCPEGDIFWELLSWNFVPCQSVVFRRDCLRRIGLLDETAPGIDDWDLWVRMTELYPAIATEEIVAIWRQPTFSSGQFSAHTERMHQLARRLHRDKWLQLPRALDVTAERRREIAHDFAAYSAQQMIWESATRLKAHRLRDFMRMTMALFRMYPLVGSRLALGKPTWRFLAASMRRQGRRAALKKM
jgi:glycosyltransferase involved in cell wall biosynthesis